MKLINEATGEWIQATWQKGKYRVTGRHFKTEDYYVIVLDTVNPMSGGLTRIICREEVPEFRGWKLV